MSPCLCVWKTFHDKLLYLLPHSQTHPFISPCSHSECQWAARVTKESLLLYFAGTPLLRLLSCTLAMIHPVPFETFFFFHPLKLLSVALYQIVGFTQTVWRFVAKNHDPLLSLELLPLFKRGTVQQKRAVGLDKTLPAATCTRSEVVAEGWKDTVSPREQHCPSYHLSKDAADWPHVHWGHKHTHSVRFIPDECNSTWALFFSVDSDSKPVGNSFYHVQQQCSVAVTVKDRLSLVLSQPKPWYMENCWTPPLGNFDKAANRSHRSSYQD